MSLFSKLTKKVFGGGKKSMKKAKVKRTKVKKSKARKAKAVRPLKKKVVKRPAAGKHVKKAAPKLKIKVKASKKAKPLKLKKGPHIAYLGLGSNVGDREEYIEQAIFLLSKTPNVKMIKKSTNYETEAEGPGDQQSFLNAAIEIQTSLDPYKLLSVVQETENALGREREVEWGPRTMDIDILLYDDQIISDDKLQVPHPLLHERLFVLKPLSEIAPNVLHPALEKKIVDIYEERKNDIGEKYDDDLPGFKDIKKGTPDDYERW
jgi:dihydroneopterin aldolase/2-amino-4-hydroxy-6-hydroxymethyldihydropteridine diphosphokinase